MKISRSVVHSELLSDARIIERPHRFALLIALIIGGLCLIASRFIRVEVLEMQGLNASVQTFEIMLAALIAFILGSILQQKKLGHMTMQAAGAAFMAMVMHNAVWVAPEVFEQFLPKGFVAQVMEETEPASLVVLGKTLAI